MKTELTHASMSDVTGLRKNFYFREGLAIQPLTRMTPQDYPNFLSIKPEDRPKFIKSCLEDWQWKTDLAKVYLKQNNLFI